MNGSNKSDSLEITVINKSLLKNLIWILLILKKEKLPLKLKKLKKPLLLVVEVLPLLLEDKNKSLT
jgi:hypothetical protein